jgi:hypothetical protein
MENDLMTKWNASEHENEQRKEFVELFKNSPIVENEVLSNLGLYMRRQDLSSMLFMHDLYKQIINVHGVVMEFGVRWGKNLALFSSLRGMFEPFNHNRKLIGFDTFEGFPSVDKKDGNDDVIGKGAFSVTPDYQSYLEKVLDYHEQESPISHIKKYELRKGDATVEIEKYLTENPQTIVALAYFDFDIYEPTKKCLEAIKGRLTKGSVIGFDELNCASYPGETLAVKEALGLGEYEIRRTPYSGVQSYIVIE